MKQTTHHVLYNIIAFFAGSLLTLAFAPFKFFLVALISPALLLFLWLNISPKEAFWRGFFYGIGLFSTGVYWVFISIHTYGNTSTAVAAFLSSSMIAYLALYPALQGYLLNRYFPTTNSAKILCAFPALWVFLEWVRSWMLSGFPWLFIGYSQTDSPLKGFAPILSVYGVSLAVLLSSALLVNALIQYKKTNYKKVYLSLAALVIIWVSGTLLSYIAWTKPAESTVQVSLVQGNIPQNLKWSPDAVQPTLDHYVDLTTPHWNSKIVIWPESAIPLPLQHAAEFVETIGNVAKGHNSTFITGIPIKAPDQEGYYNAVIAIGKGEGVYLKRHLVPFGEYVPLRQVLGQFMDWLHVPMSDFISGARMPTPLLAEGLKISAFVCYEIAYPELVLSRNNDIDLLLTVSNDAWFGRSIAQAQHLEIAKMRALEMGRSVLFVANDGITAFINAQGKIQSVAPHHVSYVLTDKVEVRHGKTPWQYLAMDSVLIILISLLIMALRLRHKNT